MGWQEGVVSLSFLTTFLLIMFKFYFQSREFYNDQGISWIAVFKDFLIPLAGVGVPLPLFYLGIRQERQRVEQQRTEDLNKSDRIDDQSLNVIFKALDAADGLPRTFDSVWEKGNKEITNKKNEIRSSTSDFGLKVLDVNVDDPGDLNLQNQLAYIFATHAQQEYSGDMSIKS